NDDATGGVRAVFSQDAVRKYQVAVHSYSAEFGKAAGGVVNIITKSGGNRVASDVFGFFRDRALNSRGHFDDVTAAGTPRELAEVSIQPGAIRSNTQWSNREEPHVRIRGVRAIVD